MRKTVAIVMVCLIVSQTTIASAEPPKPIECPNHTHVWHKEQCDANPFSPVGGGTGTGEGGLIGIVRGILKGIGLG